MKELFEDRENCFQCIRDARKLFGDMDTTESQYQKMEDTLAFGFLYCPEDLQHLFEATLRESEIRKFYFMTKVWNKK